MERFSLCSDERTLEATGQGFRQTETLLFKVHCLTFYSDVVWLWRSVAVNMFLWFESSWFTYMLWNLTPDRPGHRDMVQTPHQTLVQERRFLNLTSRFTVPATVTGTVSLISVVTGQRSGLRWPATAACSVVCCLGRLKERTQTRTRAASSKTAASSRVSPRETPHRWFRFKTRLEMWGSEGLFHLWSLVQVLVKTFRVSLVSWTLCLFYFTEDFAEEFMSWFRFA